MKNECIPLFFNKLKRPDIKDLKKTNCINNPKISPLLENCVNL